MIHDQVLCRVTMSWQLRTYMYCIIGYLGDFHAGDAALNVGEHGGVVVLVQHRDLNPGGTGPWPLPPVLGYHRQIVAAEGVGHFQY